MNINRLLSLPLVLATATIAVAQQQPPRSAYAQQPVQATQPTQPTRPAVARVPQVRPVAGQPAGAAAAQPRPREPFTLDARQQQYLDQVLVAWEKRSDQIKNFKCTFTRKNFTPLGPAPGVPMNIDTGVVSYKSPDRGKFEITESRVWTPAPLDPNKPQELRGEHKAPANPNLEHWVCDGKSIFEFRGNEKLLVERPIPPEMQGQRIVDGPLPFLFGAEATKLKARYWMRVEENPKLTNKSQVCLLAIPKRQVDRANYRAVQVILDRQSVLPHWIQVLEPGNSKSRYEFHLAEAKINERTTILDALFSAPRAPIGWKKVVEPTTPPAADRQAAGGLPQAR